MDQKADQTPVQPSASATQPAIIGGGVKKVLYTLGAVRRIGLRNTAKALTAKNTCKACGLGMGGQLGGMTNELGEFPAFCNKSIQAQSTDIQPPIPAEIFAHSLDDLRQLDGRELEHLGRLGHPIYKANGSDRYEIVDWDWALGRVAEKFAACDPARSFFYSSGRSSNEAGFVLQLLARIYGTNNVNNCSYYCHQASSVGLGATIGTGTSTIELADLTGCDLIFVIGANPASNHPRFIHILKACRDRGGKVIVINPAREPGLVKFAVPKSAKSMLTGGTEIASDYLQPRIGSDVALLKGIAKAVLAMEGQDRAFLAAHTTGFDAFLADIEATSWDEITHICGVSRPDIERVAKTYVAAKSAVFAWGMGITHHVHGVQNVEYIANLALLRGMVGRKHAGLLPLRGHSNVQGIGTIGVKPVLAREVFEKMEAELGVSLPTGKGFDTMAGMQAASEGNIDVALMMGGNLYGSNPNSLWARKALNKIGFKLFLTTTLNTGHVHGVDSGETLVLPVTARDEERQPTTQESMFNYVRLSDGGIDRLDNIRPEVSILCDVAKRLLPDSPVNFDEFSQHKHIREAIARIVPGMEELASIDVAKREFHVGGRIMHRPTFNTESGTASFRIHPAMADSSIQIQSEYPLTLTTVRSEGQFNTIVYEYNDSYRPAKSRWSIMMNRADMAALGICEGETANIVSKVGIMECVVVHGFDLSRGSVMAYFPEANVLTSTAVDPRSRTPGFKSTRVRVAIA